MSLLRLDLDEIWAKTQKHQFSKVNHVKKSSFSIKAKICGDTFSWRLYEKIDIRLSAQFATHQEISPKHGFHTWHNKIRSSVVFLWCHVQICEFRPNNSTSYLNDICRRTQSEPFFFRPVTVAFVFFEMFVSVLCLEQKRKRERACFPFVGWCMINNE